jgi:opacity protein-like surface antigen
MKHAVKLLVCGAMIAATGAIPANAADIFKPQVIEAPVFQAPEHVPAEVSGWYLRGDIGYAWGTFRGAEYYTFCATAPCVGIVAGRNTLSGDLKGTLTYGAGVGYKINHYLRTDVTVDWYNSEFTGSTRGSCGVAVNCVSTDIATVSALALMVNAYVDFGTYGRFTPYAGLGIGGAHLDWGDLSNTACEVGNPANCDPTTTHWGHSDWRFAYAIMAGVSVDVTCSLAADLGYRFRRIENGSMFSYANSTGPGFDRGINTHEVRAGLRYQFGACGEKPVEVVYQPEPLPVYK